jgi:competence protein ComEC
MQPAAPLETGHRHARWSTGVGPLLARVVLRLEGWLLAEADRWPLWAPVGLGLGISLFFALPGLPPPALGLLLGPAGLLLLLLARILLRHSLLGGLAAVAIALPCLGGALAQWRTVEVAAPVLPREGTFRLTGRIVEIAPQPKGARIVLDDLEFERLSGARTPSAVRITVRYGAEALAVGERVRLLARLQPPPGPALPHGFDFARQAYFMGLGAIGFALGKPALVEPARPGGLALAIAGLRERIARRLGEIAPGDAGAMAAALLTGLRAGISDRVWRDMQRSSLAHLISISGLHMALVASTIYLALRWGLALIPSLALRLTVKKLAAVGALAGSTFYLLLSGSSVPAERSYLMVAAGLVAILVGRQPLSMRLLACAALAVLVLQPESLLGASFQLSFAAVLALVAVYEAGGPGTRPGRSRSILGAAVRHLRGIALTTFVASTATAPLTGYHFQSIATYGVLANLVAVPVTTLWVMPTGLLGMLLMPLGLDRPVFGLMALGVRVVLWAAHGVADLPGAAIAVPQWPGLALAALVAGGLWLALWRRPWRYWGLVPLLAALPIALLAHQPALVLDPGLDMAAVRAPWGVVRVAGWHRDKLVESAWLRALGTTRSEPWPADGGGASDGLACDRDGCILAVGGLRISLARTVQAVLEDCPLVDLVIARVGPERCPGPGTLIGPRRLWRSDGLALSVAGDDLVVTTVAEGRGRWPWTGTYRSAAN